MPIESSFQVTTDSDGSVHYRHTMYREGSHADWSRETSRAAWQQASPARIAAQLIGDVNLETMTEDQRAAVNSNRATAASVRYYKQFADEASAAESEVAALNEAGATLNARIIPVLANVTGQDFREPRGWWDWWAAHNDYDQSEDRPVYETSDITNVYIPPPETKECFARGTLVWTKTGRQPIESLQLGELVLAQDVDTGELAYKPVIRRTVRPPSPILRVSFGGEEIRTTRGHPFWVAGNGWRMAKELDEEAILHGVTSSPRVEVMREAGQEEAYNLVVADFNTYFVGECGILVHDNTPRKPTRATVPGLVPAE
jgi:hypothetical protein